MIVKYGDAAFGYDFGIYRHYVGQYFDRLGDPTVVPFGWSNFSNVLRLLGSSVDQILFGWYFLFSVLILAALYSVVKNHFNAKHSRRVQLRQKGMMGFTRVMEKKMKRYL